jgi:peptide alpha-N-acetyltransferase
LKTADQLLKKNPNHGETEAMKALTINAQGNSEEGERPLARITKLSIS